MKGTKDGKKFAKKEGMEGVKGKEIMEGRRNGSNERKKWKEGNKEGRMARRNE